MFDCEICQIIAHTYAHSHALTHLFNLFFPFQFFCSGFFPFLKIIILRYFIAFTVTKQRNQKYNHTIMSTTHCLHTYTRSHIHTHTHLQTCTLVHTEYRKLFNEMIQLRRTWQTTEIKIELPPKKKRNKINSSDDDFLLKPTTTIDMQER